MGEYGQGGPGLQLPSSEAIFDEDDDTSIAHCSEFTVRVVPEQAEKRGEETANECVSSLGSILPSGLFAERRRACAGQL